MSTKELFNKALKLKPKERALLVESLIKSLDQLDEIWADESEKRLQPYREGKLEGVPMGDIFKES